MASLLHRVRAQQDLVLLSVAVYFATYLVVNSVFQIQKLHALLLAAPITLGFVFGFCWLLRSRSRKLNKPLSLKMHREFGQIRFFSDRWETKFVGSPFDGEIEITAEVGQGAPSAAQVEMFKRIRERFASIQESALLALADDLRGHQPPFSQMDLRLESLSLGNDTFSLYFGVPARREEAPDGFYVDFRKFEVEEAGWVH